MTLLPSFGLHEIYPRMMGAEVTLVAVDQALEFDLAAWRLALQRPAKMVVFSNPSNPVGCMLGRDDFLQFDRRSAARLPAGDRRGLLRILRRPGGLPGQPGIAAVTGTPVDCAAHLLQSLRSGRAACRLRSGL